MSQYYKPKKTRNIYDPAAQKPYKLSRSKIDSFIKCPHCFYLEVVLGVRQPPSFPFSLNSAVDTLLKKEFDSYRLKAQAHPLMVKAGIDAIPFSHPDLNQWRDSLHAGQTHAFPDTNLLISGGVDDVWVKPNGELFIVDYKATAKASEVTIDEEWQDGYKRQMEIYQWLFRKNNFKVSSVGYFVYCNGRLDKDQFNARLEFTISVLPYEGDTLWVDQTVKDIYSCLQSKDMPNSGEDCDFCLYREAYSENKRKPKL